MSILAMPAFFYRRNETMQEICPLCAKQNKCEAELSTCWCMHITLSEKVKKALQSISIEEGCICKACLKQLSYEEKLSTIYSNYSQTVDK